MATVTPEELTPEEFNEFDPELLPTSPYGSPFYGEGQGMASCECKQHAEGHSLPGPCGELALFKFVAHWPEGLDKPIVFYLCAPCKEWQTLNLRRSIPQATVEVIPLA